MPPAPKRKDQQLEGALERAVAQLSSITPQGCLPKPPAQFLAESVSGCVEFRLPEGPHWQYEFLRRSVLLHCETQQQQQHSGSKNSGDGNNSGSAVSSSSSGQPCALAYRTPFDGLVRHVLRHEGLKALKHVHHIASGFSQLGGATGVGFRQSSIDLNYQQQAAVAAAGVDDKRVGPFAMSIGSSAVTAPTSGSSAGFCGVASSSSTGQENVVASNGGGNNSNSMYAGSFLSIVEELWAIDRRVNGRPTAPSTPPLEESSIDARVVFAFLATTLAEMLDGIAPPSYILWGIVTLGKRIISLGSETSSSTSSASASSSSSSNNSTSMVFAAVVAGGGVGQRYATSIEGKLANVKNWLLESSSVTTDKINQILRDAARVMEEAFAPPVTTKKRHNNQLAASMNAMPPPPGIGTLPNGNGGGGSGPTGSAQQAGEIMSSTGSAAGGGQPPHSPTFSSPNQGGSSSSPFSDGAVRDEVVALVELLVGHPRALVVLQRGGMTRTSSAFQPVPLAHVAHLIDIVAAYTAIFRCTAVPLFGLLQARSPCGAQNPPVDVALSFLKNQAGSPTPNATKSIALQFNRFCHGASPATVASPASSVGTIVVDAEDASASSAPFGQFMACVSGLKRRSGHSPDVPFQILALALVQPLTSVLW